MNWLPIFQSPLCLHLSPGDHMAGHQPLILTAVVTYIALYYLRHIQMLHNAIQKNSKIIIFCYYFFCYSYWYQWQVTNTPPTSRESILHFCGSKKNVEQPIHLFFCISYSLYQYQISHLFW